MDNPSNILAICLQELERYIDYKELYGLSSCPKCKAPNAVLNKKQNPNTVMTLCTNCKSEFIEVSYKREIVAVLVIVPEDMDIQQFTIKKIKVKK